jgi:hypothetical protein
MADDDTESLSLASGHPLDIDPARMLEAQRAWAVQENKKSKAAAAPDETAPAAPAETAPKPAAAPAKSTPAAPAPKEEDPLNLSNRAPKQPPPLSTQLDSSGGKHNVTATEFGYIDRTAVAAHPEKYPSQNKGFPDFGTVDLGNPDQAGVSLPPEAINAHFGNVMSRDANGVWHADPQFAAKVRSGEIQIQVTNPDTGQSTMAPLVDIGPASGTGVGLDVLYKTARAIGFTSGKARLQYQFAGGGPRTGVPSKPAATNLSQAAIDNVGRLNTTQDPGTNHGELACADAVTRIVRDQMGLDLPKTLSTNELYDNLVKGGWQEVDPATPGAIIVSPSNSVMHGHTGIVGENGLIYSNSSATGIWGQNYTVDTWQKRFGGLGVHAFVPTDKVARIAPSEDAAPKIEDAADPTSLLNAYRQTDPDAGAGQSDAQLLTKLHDTYYPNVPQETFNQLARLPGGTQPLDVYEAKDKPPVEKFLAENPQYKDMKRDDLLKNIWESLDEGTRKKYEADALPLPGATAYDNFRRDFAPAPWENTIAQFSKELDRNLSIGGEQGRKTIAALSEFLKENTPFHKELKEGWDQLAPAFGMAKGQTGASAYDAFRDLLNKFWERNKRAAERAQGSAPQDPTMAQRLGAGAGQAIGSTPSALLSWAPFAEIPGLNILWGTTLDAISTYQQEKDAGHVSAVDVGQAGVTRAVQGLIFGSSAGRFASGLLSVVAGASTRSASDWLQGRKPNSIDDYVASAILDFSMVAMFKNEPHRPAVQEELNKAKAAKLAGDTIKAQQHVERAGALQTPTETQQTVNTVGQTVQKQAGTALPQRRVFSDKFEDRVLLTQDQAHQVLALQQRLQADPSYKLTEEDQALVNAVAETRMLTVDNKESITGGKKSYVWDFIDKVVNDINRHSRLVREEEKPIQKQAGPALPSLLFKAKPEKTYPKPPLSPGFGAVRAEPKPRTYPKPPLYPGFKARPEPPKTVTEIIEAAPKPTVHEPAKETEPPELPQAWKPAPPLAPAVDPFSPTGGEWHPVPAGVKLKVENPDTPQEQTVFTRGGQSAPLPEDAEFRWNTNTRAYEYRREGAVEEPPPEIFKAWEPPTPSPKEGAPPPKPTLQLPPGYWEGKDPQSKARFEALEPEDKARYIKHLRSASPELFREAQMIGSPEDIAAAKAAREKLIGSPEDIRARDESFESFNFGLGDPFAMIKAIFSKGKEEDRLGREEPLLQLAVARPPPEPAVDPLSLSGLVEPNSAEIAQKVSEPGLAELARKDPDSVAAMRLSALAKKIDQLPPERRAALANPGVMLFKSAHIPGNDNPSVYSFESGERVPWQMLPNGAAIKNPDGKIYVAGMHTAAQSLAGGHQAGQTSGMVKNGVFLPHVPREILLHSGLVDTSKAEPLNAENFGDNALARKGLRKESPPPAPAGLIGDEGERFYSGLPTFKFGLNTKQLREDLGDWFKSIRLGRGVNIGDIPETWKHFLDPEYLKPGRLYQQAFPEELLTPAQKIASSIREQNARRRVDQNRLVNEWIGKSELEHKLQFDPQETARRQQFWWQFSQPELSAFAQKHGVGESTGNAEVDQMMQLYGEIERNIKDMDVQSGNRFDLASDILPRLIKDPRDLRDIQDQFAAHGIDPKSVSPENWNDLLDAITNLKNSKTGKPVELKTYNPEEIMQMRLGNSLRARSKAEVIGRGINGGYIIPGDQASDLVKSNWVRIFSPGGQAFYMEPSAHVLWHNTFDPSFWDKNPIVGAPLRGLTYLKGKTVGLKLWSPTYHGLHMLDMSNISATTVAVGKWLDDTPGSGRDLAKALGDSLTLGTKGVYQSVKGQDLVMDWYRGDTSAWDRMTEGQRNEIAYQQMGGISAQVSAEREAQFIPAIGKSANKMLNAGYNIIGNWAGLKHYLFADVIPSLKLTAYNAEVKSLLEARPNLLEQSNNELLRHELGKIGRTIDSRFGELNYDNLFWNKSIKQAAIASYLSAGWALGTWRMVGGAVHDVSSNLAHMDQVIKTLREEGVKPAARRVLTNRVIFAAQYTFMTALKSALITAAFTGGINSIKDLFYPRVGKNPDGTDKRITTPFWGRELYDLFTERDPLKTMGINKLSPVASAVVELATNMDYQGHEIYSSQPAENFEQFAGKIGDVLSFAFAQSLEPMPLENLMTPKEGRTAGDIGLSILGFGQAPARTERSDLENQIIADFRTFHGGKVPREEVQKHDLARQYRSAINADDPLAAKTALDQAERLGLKIDTRRIGKQKGESSAELVFDQLPPRHQAAFLRKMSEEDRAKFWPRSSKEGKREYARTTGAQ